MQSAAHGDPDDATHFEYSGPQGDLPSAQSPRQLLDHVVPMIEVFVESAYRQPLINAVRPFIVGRDDPDSIDAVDRDSCRPERRSVGGARRHVRKDRYSRMPFVYGAGIGALWGETPQMG
jgi:hypothetical protein